MPEREDAPRVRLRPFTPADAAIVRRAHREGLGPYVARVWGWDEDAQAGFVATLLESPTLQVVEVDGDAAGYLDVVDHTDHVNLANIVLVPEFHRRGIGTRLVEQVLARADARGVPVRLTVLHPNPARRLYERVGFRETDRDAQRAYMERVSPRTRQ